MNSTAVQTPKKKGNIAAIITMFFLFAMIAFVTNLAAPIGTIWGFKFEGNSFLGMLGNMMNFLAYLIMGIPAGRLIQKIGYKKTALWAMAVGAFGLFVQWLSSIVGSAEDVWLRFAFYLAGAFISGFCVCMLNTVVNPMLNTLGGGGKKGNQLLQLGSSCNSLAATLSPLLVGLLIGRLTYKTDMTTVAPLLWIAIGIFVVAFIVISLVNIPDENAGTSGKKVVYTHSAWSFRHTVLGVIGIFFYVGIEVGIPGTLNYYLSLPAADGGAGIVGNAAAIAGAVVAVYWLLMLVGRLLSSSISGKVSSRAQLIFVSALGIGLVVAAICTYNGSRIALPKIVYNPESNVRTTLSDANVDDATIERFINEKNPEILVSYTAPAMIEEKDGTQVQKQVLANSEQTPEELVMALNSKSEIPLCALFLVLVGLCTSLMWGSIFNLAVEGIGKYTAQASGIFMMMVFGGGVMPLLQQLLAKGVGYMNSYWLIVGMLGYLFFYSLSGSKNVNKDIPVDDIEEEIPDAL